MKSREDVIYKLWEDSNHGTRREDVENAYNAGAKAERDRCIKLCDESASALRRSGCNHEASAVEYIADDMM